MGVLMKKLYCGLLVLMCTIGYSTEKPSIALKNGESVLVNLNDKPVFSIAATGQDMPDQASSSDKPTVLVNSVEPCSDEKFEEIKQAAHSAVNINDFPIVNMNFYPDTMTVALKNNAVVHNTEKLVNLQSFPETLKNVTNDILNVDEAFMENDKLIFKGIRSNTPCVLSLTGNDCNPKISLDFMNHKCNMPRIIGNNLSAFEITCALDYKMTNVILDNIYAGPLIFGEMNWGANSKFDFDSAYRHFEFTFNSSL